MNARGIAVLGVIALAVVASFAYLAIDVRGLFTGESMRAMGKFVAEFFPPDLSPDFLAKTGWGRCCTSTTRCFSRRRRRR